MSSANPIGEIIFATHENFRNVPENIRKREERKEYMSLYMRSYRKARCNLNVSLPKERYGRLADAAKAHNRKPTTFLREAAFAYLEQRRILPKSIERALADITVAIHRVGNNINQIAHQANIKRESTRQELAEANRLLAELQKTVTGIIAVPYSQQ